MARKIQTRALHDHETEMIRLVAAGYTNAQLAVAFDISVETIRSRMHVVHQLIGTASGNDSDNVARVRMVIWAYDHGVVRPAGAPPKPAEVLPQERVPVELAAPMIRLSISILSDEPRGDLKRWARRVVDAARLQVPGAMGRPPAVAADAGEGIAA